MKEQNVSMLKKIANNDLDLQLIEAIRKICGSNTFDDLISLIPEIEDKYPNVIYSGNIYRKMIIPFEILDSMNHYIENDQEYIDKEEFVQEIKNFVTTGEYQSCTYSIEACKNFYPLEDGISFIISFDGEGIDLQQLCEELSYSDDEEVAKDVSKVAEAIGIGEVTKEDLEEANIIESDTEPLEEENISSEEFIKEDIKTSDNVQNKARNGIEIKSRKKSETLEVQGSNYNNSQKISYRKQI